MTDTVPAWLWILFTLLAAGAQVARNAMQRGLAGALGTTGATHVRFLFGLPFALIFLAITWTLVDWQALSFERRFFLWLALGAGSQIIATAWMLVVMQSRSFVVTTAAIKTEPVQVALFGAIILTERIGSIAIFAVIVTTLGVLLMSWPRREAIDTKDATSKVGLSWWPILIGIAAGGMFALSAVGFRGAILSLVDTTSATAPFYVRATVTLACGLLLQSAVLSAYLMIREPGVLRSIFRAWRPSLLAGLLGAVASQFWFLAFSVETVSRVRTLALVEVMFAQVISRRIFSQTTSRIEACGIGLIVVGVIILLNT